jgi:phosphatidylserine decarboxylase
MILKLLLQHLLPHHLVTAFIRIFTHTKVAWLKNGLIAWFAKAYQVDMSTAVEPNPLRYASFNDFFTRALRPECRPLAPGANTLLCPVDGTVSQIGPIEQDHLFQAKGHRYSLTALLSRSDLAAEFRNGQFATIYLAPYNYHRIHMPMTGTLREMVYVPGQLFSVAPLTVEHVPGLFARNERVVCMFDTAIGPMAVILVGAMCVASMETVWAGTLTPTKPRELRQWDYRGKGVTLERGAELGRFNMGSTVILLLPGHTSAWEQTMTAGETVWMGKKLGETST